MGSIFRLGRDRRLLRLICEGCFGEVESALACVGAIVWAFQIKHDFDTNTRQKEI